MREEDTSALEKRRKNAEEDAHRARVDLEIANREIEKLRSMLNERAVQASILRDTLESMQDSGMSVLC